MPQRTSVGRLQLKPTQERVLAALSEDGSAELTRGEYETIAGVSRSQAAYDLAELVEARVLDRIGGGRSTRYRLARHEQPGQRRWTDERIRAALTEFCAGRETWPSASEFKEAGRADLYVAASRYGGIGSWASQLGFPRPGRAAPPRKPARSWRPIVPVPRLRAPSVNLPRVRVPSVRVPRMHLPTVPLPRPRWIAEGAALVAGVLLVAAGAAVIPGRDAPDRQSAAPQAATASSPAMRHATHPARRTAKATTHAHAAKPKQVQQKQVRRQTRVASPPATPRVATTTHAEFAVAKVPATTAQSAASTTKRSTSSGGPAPLPAPTSGGGGAPGPIPPPGH